MKKKFQEQESPYKVPSSYNNPYFPRIFNEESQVEIADRITRRQKETEVRQATGNFKMFCNKL